MQFNNANFPLAREFYELWKNQHQRSLEETAENALAINVPDLSKFGYCRPMGVASSGELRFQLTAPFAAFLAAAGIASVASQPLTNSLLQAVDYQAAQYLLVAAPAGANLLPYDDGNNSIFGLIQYPVVQTTPIIPEALAQSSVTTNFGAAATLVALPGATFSGQYGGRENAISAAFSITSAQYSPNGMWATPLGPIMWDPKETHTSSATWKSPVGDTQEQDWTYTSAVPAFGAQQVALVVNAAPVDICNIQNVTTPYSTFPAAGAANFLFNPNGPATIDFDVCFDVLGEYNSIVGASNLQWQVFAVVHTPYYNAAGALNDNLDVYQSTTTMYSPAVPAPLAGNTLDHTYRVVVPFKIQPRQFAQRIQISISCNSAQGGNWSNTYLSFIEVKHRFQRATAHKRPYLGAYGLSTTTNLTFTYGASMLFPVDVRQSLVYRTVEADDAIYELLRCLESRMTAAAKTERGLMRRPGDITAAIRVPPEDVAPTDADAQIMKVDHASKTFVLPALGTIAGALPSIFSVGKSIFDAVTGGDKKETVSQEKGIQRGIEDFFKRDDVQRRLMSMLQGSVGKLEREKEETKVRAVQLPMPPQTPVASKKKKKGVSSTGTRCWSCGGLDECDVPAYIYHLNRSNMLGSVFIRHDTREPKRTKRVSQTATKSSHWFLGTGRFPVQDDLYMLSITATTYTITSRDRLTIWEGRVAQSSGTFSGAAMLSFGGPCVVYAPASLTMSRRLNRQRVSKTNATIVMPGYPEYCEMSPATFCNVSSPSDFRLGVGYTDGEPGDIWLLRITDVPIRFTGDVEREVQYSNSCDVRIDSRLYESFDGLGRAVALCCSGFRMGGKFITSLCSSDGLGGDSSPRYYRRATGGSLIAATISLAGRLPIPENIILTGQPFSLPREGPTVPVGLSEKKRILREFNDSSDCGVYRRGVVSLRLHAPVELLPIFGNVSTTDSSPAMAALGSIWGQYVLSEHTADAQEASSDPISKSQACTLGGGIGASIPIAP